MIPMTDELKVLGCIRSARWEGRIATPKSELMAVLNAADDAQVSEVVERMKADELISGGKCDVYSVLKSGLEMLGRADKCLLDSVDSKAYVEAWHKLSEENWDK